MVKISNLNCRNLWAFWELCHGMPKAIRAELRQGSLAREKLPYSIPVSGLDRGHAE